MEEKNISELRNDLKKVLSNLIEELPQNMNELSADEKINITIKLLPYVFPKVNSINAFDGEVMTFDW